MPRENYVRYVRTTTSPAEDLEIERVDALALTLLEHLDGRRPDIDSVHVHNAGSGVVQKIVSELLTDELEFGEEIVLTPQDGLVTHARPDFFFRLDDGRGVLAEVERGGTTTNNHDLKDIWKAHISPDTQHLFLIVPMSNWREDGSSRERPFRRVTSRVGAFFGDPRREVDVVSAHVFGYGRSE